jgi:hypothetical protein
MSCKADSREFFNRIRHKLPFHNGVYGKRLSSPEAHSITSSARTRREGGMARPSAFATFRLIKNSSFAGCSTGSDVVRQQELRLQTLHSDAPKA